MTETIAEALLFAKQNAVDKLDGEILLAHALEKPRSFLFAFPEKKLTSQIENNFKQLISERKKGIPIPYLTGYKEFWSLDFMVSPATLIPRPETELLVELTLEYIQGEKKVIADLGTGSGVIGLSIAHERPNWEIHAVDINVEALKIAQKNAEKLALSQVLFHQGSWCHALPAKKFSAIVSNPPYLSLDDPHLYSLSFEPKEALVTAEAGLHAIQEIISQAENFLEPQGYLLLEHGAEQGDGVRKIFQKMRYTHITLHQDLSGLDRVTIGKFTG